MNIEIVIRDSIRCNGESNGRLAVDLLNAAQPVIYLWDDIPGSNEFLTDVAAGLHYVKVTDAHECISYDTLDVSEPDVMESDIYITDASCFDSTDALVELGTQGGNGGYYYLWNDTLVEGNTIENQSAGQYQLTIRDRKDCELIETVIIEQPEQLVIDASEIIEPDCEYSNNGEITVSVQGGISPYTYNWPDFENNSSNNVTGIGPGNITVIVTDNHNCAAQKTFEIESRLTFCLEIPSAFSPNGDGTNDLWIIKHPSDERIAVAEVYSDLIIEVYDRTGQKVWISEAGYSQSVESGWDGRDKLGNYLPVDTYYYFVYLNNGSGRVEQDIVTIIR